MSNPSPLKAIVAALVLSLSADASYPADCNAHITPDGYFRADDGRPRTVDGVEVDDWQMNAEIAAALIADFEASGKPILYDYEHNSLYGDSRAAGWIVKLVYAPGRGLFGKVEWTPDAAEDIAKKVWRYSSPLFIFNPKTGAVVRLLSVALTNNPALGDLGAVDLVRRAALAALPLGALANNYLTAGGLPGNQNGDTAMTPEQIAALTSERDTLKTQLVALTAERDKANTELAALRKQASDQAEAAEKEKHTALLTAALTDGRIPPTLKGWAEKQDFAALTEYLAAKEPLAILEMQTDGKAAPNAGGQLTPDELAMCSRMNVKPEDFIAAKADK